MDVHSFEIKVTGFARHENASYFLQLYLMFLTFFLKYISFTRQMYQNKIPKPKPLYL